MPQKYGVSTKGVNHTGNSVSQTDINSGELLKSRIGSSLVRSGNKALFQITDYGRTPAQKLVLGEVIAAIPGSQYFPDDYGCLLLRFREQ